MNAVRVRLRCGTRLMAACLALWVCLTLVLACSSEDPTPDVVTADSAEVGKTLLGEGWSVTLVGQPELTKQLGSGTATQATGMGDSGSGQTGVRVAEGMWLILTAEITNESEDLAMLSGNLVKVVDAQETEHSSAGQKVHAPLIHADERWEGQQENQLIQWVFETGVPREGPLVFDVPEDAAGLKLTMKGTAETIDLGF